MVDSVRTQLEHAAKTANLTAIFGALTFDAINVQNLEAASEGDVVELGFSNTDGPIGVLTVDLCDSGNPDDAGLTVGLRGWHLNEDVASV